MFRKIYSLEEVKNFTLFSDIATRFILVPSFSHLRNLYKQAQRLRFDIYFLTEFMNENIKWIDNMHIIKAIEDLSSKSDLSFLFSVDNQIRFYEEDEFNSFFKNALRVKVRKGYVIVVLSGLKERLSKLVQRGKLERDFIFEYTDGVEEKVKLIVLSPEIKVKDKKFIESFTEFLNLWMREDKEHYINVPSIYKNSGHAKPDSAVEIKKLDGYKDYGKFVLNLENFSEEDESFWKSLVQELEKEKVSSVWDLKILRGLDKTGWLSSYLRTNNIWEEKLLKYYAEKFFKIPQNLSSNKVELVCELYLKDKEINFGRIFSEHAYISEKVCERLKKQNKYGDFLLDCEGIRLILDYKEGRREIYWKMLEYYLDDIYPVNLKEDWVVDYFRAYKEAKLKNEITKDIRSLVGKLNKDVDSFYKWYVSFELVVNLFKKLKEDNGIEKVLWIDCLGFEWAGLLVNLLREKGVEDLQVYIAKANLPSTTEFNRFDLEKRIDDFDRLIHERYKYPESIVKQFKTLKEIITKHIDPKERIMIVSDHGSSALPRLENPNSITAEVFHGGRYAKGLEKNMSCFVFEGEYAIALSHASIYGRPQGEAHGGALPEEVLTMIILLNAGSRVEYKIFERIEGRSLYFRLEPEGKPQAVYVDGKRFDFEKTEEEYIIKLAGLKAGKHTLKVVVEGKEFTKEFEFKGGMHEGDLGLS